MNEKKARAFDIIQKMNQMQIEYQNLNKELVELQEEINKEK